MPSEHDGAKTATVFAVLRQLEGGVGSGSRLGCRAFGAALLDRLLVLQRRSVRKHAQVFFSYGPFIMGDSHSFVAKLKPR